MTPILNGIAIKYRPIYLYIQALKKKFKSRFREILILKFFKCHNKWKNFIKIFMQKFYEKIFLINIK